MGKSMTCALTFDDGPNTVTTPEVLKMLERFGVPASFFLVGNSINEQSAAVSKKAYDMGCEICCHSKTHSAMTELSPDEIRAEIKYTNAAIERITGKPPRFFRPPYIAVNRTMCDNIPMTFIAGTGAEDWLDSVSADERADRILSQVKDGEIILLHDMEGNFRTVDALVIIIPELLRRGFKLLTVSGLFERNNVEPLHGVIYSNVFKADRI